MSAALLLAVFTAGCLAGSAMDRAPANRDDRPHGRGKGLRGMETEVLERLDLDERQRAEIMAERWKRMENRFETPKRGGS